MKTLVLSLAFLLTLLKLYAQEISLMKLKQAFKYENNNVPEFSGLCLKDGDLYAVNDKNINCLYRLKVDSNNSRFSAECVKISEDKDFEAICYYKDAFFVIEEKECKVYKIINNQAMAYGVSFFDGLLYRNYMDTGEKRNKQVESLAMLSDSTFLVVTERDINTLAKISKAGEILLKNKIPPLQFTDSYMPDQVLLKDKEKNANSFSDLCIFKGKGYLLERKKKMIHVIDIIKDSFPIVKTLYFKNSIEDCEEYHEYYGAAEGLAIDENYIYIILDNNTKNEKEIKFMCDKKRRTLFQFYNDNF